MKTIKYQDIDGFRIVTGSGQLTVDPAASKVIAENEIAGIIDGGCKSLPEMQLQVEKIKEKSLHERRAIEAKQKARALMESASEAADKKDFKAVSLFDSEIKKLDQIYQDEQAASRLINNELKQIKVELEPKLREIRRKNLAYCEPGKNEMIDKDTADLCMSKLTEDMTDVILPDGVTIDGLIKAHNQKLKNEQVCIDGTKVSDFRGCQWFYQDADGNWIESEIISRIGLTKKSVVVDEYENAAIEKSELTPDQVEEIRIQGLTAEQKKAEFDSLNDHLLSEAAEMKNKLDIQGVEDSLKQSQVWYAEELADLQTKYGIV